MTPSRNILGRPLGEIAQIAFDKLCQLGCKEEELDGCICWLAEESVISIGSVQTIRNQPLDSWDEAFGGLTRDEVQVQIPNLAMKLEHYVLLLQKTPAIEFLNATERIKDSDILFAATAPPLPWLSEQRTHPAFDALRALPEIASQVGIREYPDLTRHLIRLVRYVKSRTGSWRDAQIVTILTDCFPTHFSIPKDQELMKKWRRKHGLYDPRKPKRRSAPIHKG
jgi:hypothetical protein